jgi:hypothetical protein
MPFGGGLGGRGPVYDMIVSAINDRGVSNVAIAGYSHGGGKTFVLSQRLEANLIAASGVTDIKKPFIVPFTAYVDAIRANDTIGEVNKPRLSEFHTNQYQENPIIFGLTGESTNFGDDNFDRTYSGVNHWTVVNHEIVLDFMRMRFRQRVLP